MKKINGYTVYEENDECALDEYSEQLANDLTAKEITVTSIVTTQAITSYEIENVKKIYIEGTLLTENIHYTKTNSEISFLFTVPSRNNFNFRNRKGC